MKEIKEKIFELKKIPINEQIVTFSKEKLKDEKTLTDYKIEKGATVKIEIISNLEIIIIGPKIELKLKVNTMDLIEEVLTQIADTLKISIYRLSLTFENSKM